MKETLEEKLRNQLGPLFSVTSGVLISKEHPEIIPLITKTADIAEKSKSNIKLLLGLIESGKTYNCDTNVHVNNNSGNCLFCDIQL